MSEHDADTEGDDLRNFRLAPPRPLDRVVTYHRAYDAIGTTTLCPDHAEDVPFLGEVAWGPHAGTCEACEAERCLR